MTKGKTKVILILTVIIFSIGIIYSSYNILDWYIASAKTKSIISDLRNSVIINESSDSNSTEIIENDVPKSDPYWDYIKMKLIDVDFTNLKDVNKDIVGWIKVEGTNINYPFVQTNNNSYYLSYSIDKSYSQAGWVFLDYRNNLKELDKNTIIYAHGRYDGTMFGTLKNILSTDWVTNSNNYIVKISTAYENTLWQIFSIYTIPTTTDYLQTKFNANEFTKFTNLLISRSNFNFNTQISEDDKILTLSTCYNELEKVVLHAKLIKRETK